jgi:hypothetical protein
MKTTQLLRLQVRLTKERLHDFCKTNGLSVKSALRVAHHKLYNEDVLQEPPDFDPHESLTPWQHALQVAKGALRLQYEASANEPESKYRAGWWECPSMTKELECVRQEHRRRKGSEVSEWDEFLAKLPDWLRKAVRNESLLHVRVSPDRR